MRIEFDRDTCIGMFQCVDEWAGFEENVDEGKADLVAEGAEQREADLFVVEVPDGEELDAEFAARACPVDAIRLYDGDEQVV